jgi:predicted molibdopterin-dependent oxidoreductase YjgC
MTEFHRELEGESKRSLATQCPFCSVQCKMQVVEKRGAERKEFEAVGVLNPASEGRLCIKGMNAYQHVFHPDRILSPLKKVKEQWVRIDWSEALTLIAEKFTSLQQAYGRDTIGVYGGGSLTNESAYLLGKFARVTHYLTGVLTRRSHTLVARNVESYVEIHPKTARKFGIEDATLVKLESKRGHVFLRGKVTADIREDTLFVPMHWGDWQNINKVTNPALDPTCKMPSFKVSAVKVSPLVPHSFSL